MIATERLYYTRPELDRAEARVLALEGSVEAPVLVLDRTIFYPEGGGQPCDLGKVGAATLASVSLEGERILHHLAGPLAGLAVGASVALELDAGRRRDHAEQHSGQHLLSSVCLRLLGAETKSFHLGAERSTIDLGIAAMDEGDLTAVEAAVNEIIAEAYPIRIHVCPPGDLDSFPLRKRPPAGEEEIRVVEIDGIDYSPCCGTHLAGTGALRLLKLLGAEKYKGMTRLAFVAGGRAFRDYAAAQRRCREAAKALGSSQEDLAAEANRAALRLKEALAAVERLKTERALLEAERAL
ncbi:MAG: alanyl-tRNA editing protein, partial [Spirochaetaceae bacterium]|nr:alanyl-tRNA editing protein [Spirochaetaceae bacterium]